jgi:hypothetical protein
MELIAVRFFILIFSLFALSACSAAKVRARTLYTDRSFLASRIRDTPDPAKGSTGQGQLLWIRWNVPENYTDLHLDAIIRFTDKTDRTEQIPLKGLFGAESIEISSTEFTEKGPILSYQILLKNGEKTLASTKHKLWVEKIIITDQ